MKQCTHVISMHAQYEAIPYELYVYYYHAISRSGD